MLEPFQLEELPVKTRRIYSGLEMKTMELILRTIIDNTEDINQWIINKKSLIRKIDKTMKELIKQSKLQSYDELNNMETKLGKSYEESRKQYFKSGLYYDSIDDILILIGSTKENIKQELKQTITIENIGFLHNGTYQSFNKYIDKIGNEIIIKNITNKDEKIDEIINDMTKSGLRITRDKGITSERIDNSASGIMMKNISKVIGSCVRASMNSLNTDYVEVSAHITARPTHQIWQGKVYYWARDGKPEKDQTGQYKDFITETEYGDMLGLLGINCYHTFWAFVPGVMKRKYTDEELEVMRNKSIETHNYNGKSYTPYEATQRQRAIERIMRKIKQDINLGKQAGMTEKMITEKQNRFMKWNDEYVKFSKEMNLEQQYGRIYKTDKTQ